MTKNQQKKIAVAGATFLASVLLPVMVFAQGAIGGTSTQSLSQACGSAGYSGGTAGSGTISGVICTIYHIIQIVIPVLILGAVAYFIWGIVQFITAGDAEEKSAARGTMVHGIIGFAVILGLWGLVNILLTTFGVNNNNATNISFPSF